MRRTRRIGVLLTGVALAAGLVGCGSSGSSSPSGSPGSSGSSSGGSGEDSGSSGSITVWTLQNLPDRMKVQNAIAADFTKQTGIKVKVVGIDEQQFPQLIATAAQSGKMPDVMGSLSLGDVRQIATQKLINTDAAAAVIKELDPKTFAPSALSLTKDGDAQLEVPSDAWAQILVYRKDLFAKAGLKPPTTYDALLAAAKKLTTDGQFGITLATDPADTFTGQSFEAVALGNDCQLVDGKGTITLDSPQCAKAFDLYGQLAQNYSPKGTQTVDTTRASYFAGKSAMVMWSTYILDELAGLRNDALPTCPECKGDKTWLAKDSGIVTNIQGPDSKSGGDYGEIAGWTISSSAKADAAEKFVEFVMSTDYTKWLGMAPEGEFPVRKGPKAGSTEYVDAWSDLKAGVDTKAPLSSIYDAATMKEITGVASSIDRWALPEGQGDLIGPLTAQNTIPKVIAALGSGSIDAQQAQQQAQAAVEKVKGSLK